MALKQSTTYERPVPHEPGHWLRFRELDLTELTAARLAQQRTDMQAQRQRLDVLGAELVKEMSAIYAAQKTNEPAAAPDPIEAALERYDAGTLLRLAVVAWSYEAEEPTDPISQLDARTAQWAVRDIVSRHVLTGPEAEAERGNGSAPSISHLTG